VKIIFSEKFNGEVRYAKAPQVYDRYGSYRKKNAMKNVMLSSCNNVMKLFIAWWEMYKCLQTPLKISVKKIIQSTDW
jgi:hypothetical protein